MESSPKAFEDSEKLRLKINKLPVGVILLVELCERLTYYTLAGTQKIYFQNQLGKTPSTAAALNSVFSMLCYFWCIPGGLLADSIGRYKTIIGSGVIYALGTICVGIAVIHEFQISLGWLFTVSCLLLIAMGTGGIKPNIANFGADQIGDATEEQRQCQATFFSLFYLSINIGVLVAFGFLCNTTTGGLAGVIPQSEGYSFAYGSGAGCMILAVILFVSFTRSYTMLPGNGLAPVKRLIRYQIRSVRKGGGWRAAMSAAGFVCLPLFYIVTLANTLVSSSVETSGKEVVIFKDPCAASLDAPRRLHSSGNEDVLSDIALGLGALACIFLIVPASGDSKCSQKSSQSVYNPFWDIFACAKWNLSNPNKDVILCWELLDFPRPISSESLWKHEQSSSRPNPAAKLSNIVSLYILYVT